MDEKTIGLVVTVFLAAFTAWGLILGLIRGLWRTLVRDIWIAAIAICLALFSSAIAVSACGEDISRLNIYMDGELVTSVKALAEKYITTGVGADAQSAQAISELALALASSVLGGAMFFVFFLALKILSLPIYYIINIFIFAPDRNRKHAAAQYRKQNNKGNENGAPVKYSKHRLLGGLCGAISGFAVAAIFLSPVSGYLDYAKAVDKATAPSENESGIVTANAGETYAAIANGYYGSEAAKIFAAIGADKVQLALFDMCGSATYNGIKFTLSDEIENFAKAYAVLSEYSDFKIEEADDDKIIEMSEALQQAVELLFKSNIIKSAMPAASKFAASYIDKMYITEETPQYLKDFISSCTDALKQADGTSVESDVSGVVKILQTLAKSKILLPIYKNQISAQLFQDAFTKDVCSELCTELFSIPSISKITPAFANFMLGYVSANSEVETESQTVTSEQMQTAITNILTAAVDVFPAIDVEKGINPDGITEKTAEALGEIFDSFMGLLSESNYASVINFAESKINEQLASQTQSLPKFVSDSLSSAIENLSEIESVKTELKTFYQSYVKIKAAYDGAMEDGKLQIGLLDLETLGEGIDYLAKSALFGNGVYSNLTTGAIDYLGEQLGSAFGEDVTITFTEKAKGNLSAAIQSESLVWKNELPLFSGLLTEFSDLSSSEDAFAKIKSPESQSLKNIGKALDKVGGGIVFGGGACNILVRDLLDIASSKTGGDMLNGALSTAVDEIKTNVGDNADIVWEAELDNVHTLLSVDFENITDDNIVSVGEKLDKVVFGAAPAVKSAIITQPVIDKLISSFIDQIFDSVSEGDDLYATLNSVKNSFDGSTAKSYSAEFGAAIQLKSINETVSAENFNFAKDASALGADIDGAITKGAKIINKSLINSFITSNIDTYVFVTGQFSDLVSNLKNRLSKDFSYETEFGYIEDMLYITNNCGEITLANVNKPTAFNGEQPSEAKTLGARLDAVAPSLLAGDCGLSALSQAMKTYSEDNVGFADVNTVIIFNFNALKSDVKCAENYNEQHTVLYSSVMQAFSEIYSAMTEQSSKITGNTDFTMELAENYESTLDNLQDNIIVGKNGARAMAAYVAKEVKAVVMSKKPSGANEIVSAAFDKVSYYVDDYIAYLKRADSVSEKEPYADFAVKFAYSDDGFATLTFETDESKSGYSAVRVNKPFGYIYERLAALLA